MNDTRAKILVVDDEENNRNVVAAQLKNEGYIIVPAASGEEALQLIDQELPDLVLLDAMMPGISGFDVAEILKGEARTASIPIIMITALSDGDSRLAGLTNGVEEFLTKPVARSELVTRIRNLIKLKKNQDGLKAYSSVLEKRIAENVSALESANLKLSEAHRQLLQAERMSALGQLAAGVAHEINNPIGYVSSNLGTLKGYAKDLLRVLRAYEELVQAPHLRLEKEAQLASLKSELEFDYLCEDAPQLIDESIEGLSRARLIVQDLKTFAHADAQPEWELADLNECLDSTLNIANNEIKYKARAVKEYGELPLIECLPSQLNQVFLNLLVNAAQAMPESAQGTISIRTGSDQSNVWAEVSDTGAGIRPENLDRIFEPFFTTKPVNQGTGLGLSVSYGIVKKHGGAFEVQSELGVGTTFKVTLPIRRPPSADASCPSSAEENVVVESMPIVLA